MYSNIHICVCVRVVITHMRRNLVIFVPHTHKHTCSHAHICGATHGHHCASRCLGPWWWKDISRQNYLFMHGFQWFRGIHRSPLNSLHKGQWRGALMFSLICGWINGWVNNREAGDLRRHRPHYDVIVMFIGSFCGPRLQLHVSHDDVMTRFLYYWHSVRGIHWSPVNYPHKRLQCFIGTPNKLFNKQSWCSCHRNVVNLCNKDHPLSAIGQQVTHKRPRNISLSLNWLSLMMTSSNRNIFRVIGLLCGEITGHRWIPLTKASNAELWGFLWSAINDWENNRDAGDLRRHRAHYDVIVMHD